MNLLASDFFNYGIMMAQIKFVIKDTFDSNDPVFKSLTDTISNYNNVNKLKLIINITYNEGGEVAIMLAFVATIEKAVLNNSNLSIELRFGGFAMSAAAFVFCYFVFYADIPRVRVLSNTRLSVIYHKPRMKQKKVSNFIFANDPIKMKKLTKKQQTDLISYTNQFDAVWDAVVAIYEMGGGAFDPSLLSSYNGNGDFAFTLSNRVFKGGY
ncbi:hypothetical protein RFH71_005100 [Klebsiella pneumoniae]|uniref:hypothetical protein n=1 Tax=Klebsiella quasipneumoniae TaxID=1463165 RepID=UPI001CCFD456|nr:hypothetical protein [Klebsiella quasipneumoniae]ELA2423814.1 hypothetical protein [Klebsiella pneumoniae]MBZ6710527.1 hypothetical protein [Klebsiella quasipneumoniae]HCB0324973.1 hypothetical protein [Klebsiella pneumoniae]HDS9651863.1 hypothetical protein [Klebsiella pneumoniae subsp. pneumoniae]